MTRRVKGPAAAELDNHILPLRKAAGLTQAQLATTAGVTRKTINTVERGHYVPSTVLALRIAAALDTTVEDIFLNRSGFIGDCGVPRVWWSQLT